MTETENVNMETGVVAAQGPNGLDAFLQTGRTGRRNAVPDILGKEAKDSVSTADLPISMEKLSCSDPGEGTSGKGNSSAGTNGMQDSNSPDKAMES